MGEGGAEKSNCLLGINLLTFKLLVIFDHTLSMAKVPRGVKGIWGRLYYTKWYIAIKRQHRPMQNIE